MRNHSRSSMLSIYGKLHIVISKGGGKNNNPSAVLHMHFGTHQKPHTLFAENNKNTGLCQRDGKFDGFLQAVLTTPFDSLLYTRKNQSSAANWFVNADK